MSRITGVIRDMLIARYFGATAATDAFYVAFRLPNMLRRLFAEGAFQQAFVPMLSDVRERNAPGRTQSFLEHVFTILGLAVFAASVLGVLAAPLLVLAIAGGMRSDPEAFDLAVALTRWMFPYIAFMSLVALAASILNTMKRFAIPAATPILLNLSFIGATILLTPYFDEPIWALAAAVLIGGVLQLGAQIAALAKLGCVLRPRGIRASLADADVRKVLSLMLPALFGVGVAQLSILINTNIASHLGHGAVTWLNYADRLMEFPTALLGVALGTVLLPGLSAAHARGDAERYNALLDHGLRLVVLVGIPAALGLWLTSEALVAFLFQGKNFSPADVAETARAVVGYSVGLIGLITLKIAAPAFYARKDIRTPVRIAFLSLVVVQLLNLATVPLFDQAGLALSVGLGSCVNAGSLLLILGRRGIYRPRAGWGKFLLQVAAGSLGGGVARHGRRTLVCPARRLVDGACLARPCGRHPGACRRGGGGLLPRHDAFRLAPARSAPGTRSQGLTEKSGREPKNDDARARPSRPLMRAFALGRTVSQFFGSKSTMASSSSIVAKGITSGQAMSSSSVSASSASGPSSRVLTA